MDTLEQLRQRVHNAVVNLANGMAAADDAVGVLSVDKITVDITVDGVVVKFIDKPVKKKSVKVEKDFDES